MAKVPETQNPKPETATRWQHFRKSRTAIAALIFLGFLMFVALFADLLANEKPIYCRYNGEIHYPIFTPNKIDSIVLPSGEKMNIAYNRVNDWRKLPLEAAAWPLIAYSDKYMDRDNQGFIAPGKPQRLRIDGKDEPLPARFRHWLGTTRNGQDVLGAIMHSTRISLLVGIVSVAIAAIIGIFLGAMAGYFGDHRLQASRSTMIALPVGLFFAWFYGLYVRRFVLEEAGAESFGSLLGELIISLLLSLGIIGLLLLASRLLHRFSYFAHKVKVPVDSFVTRLIEILRALPVIILVISFSIVFKGSIWFIILIIGFTGWSGIARLVRAEMLRNVNLDYIEAARSLGYSERRTLFRHALPNGLTPALVAISFGIASAIIAESSLSFLNIGVDPDSLSWGELLKMGSTHFEAWWLTVFPGLAIFLTVLSFNLVGERLRDVLDPRR